MLLIGHTQVRENYGYEGNRYLKCKGGHTYLLARLSANEVARLGKAGLAALANERRPHVENYLLPEDISGCGDYEETLVNWELAEDDYQTEDQRLWAKYPEMRGPWEKTRPCLPDRTELSDRGRLAAHMRREAEYNLLGVRPGESEEEYVVRARLWVATCTVLGAEPVLARPEVPPLAAERA